MGDRYISSDENKYIIYFDANNLNGWAMCQLITYDEIEILHGRPNLSMDKLEGILKTADDSDIGYFVEVDLKYPDNKKQKKNFLFAPEIKKITLMILHFI